MKLGAFILIGIGSFFFLANFINIRINWNYIWPLILVAVGINMLRTK